MNNVALKMTKILFCLFIYLVGGVLYCKSSDSDKDSYKSACYLAATDNDEFSHFKQNLDYTEILDGYGREVGEVYLSEIIKKNLWALDKINEYKRNDIYGDPLVFDFSEVGQISSATLGYIYNASEIVTHFGDLSNLSIVEIGGGYGGQCLILSIMSGFKSYRIFDLEEAAMLSGLYLSKHGVNNVKTSSWNQLSEVSYDLILSNYAFSECSREMQDFYFENIIKNVKLGYMVLNYSSNSYSHEDIIERLKSFGFSVEIIEDFPKANITTKRVVFKK